MTVLRNTPPSSAAPWQSAQKSVQLSVAMTHVYAHALSATEAAKCWRPRMRKDVEYEAVCRGPLRLSQLIITVAGSRAAVSPLPRYSQGTCGAHEPLIGTARH